MSRLRVQAFAVLLASLALGLAPSSCSNDECDGGEVYCDGQGVIHYCSEKGEAGIFGAPHVWFVGANCGNAARCNVAHGYAFCSLDPARVPECKAPDGAQCAGQGQLVCEAGLPVAWDYCADSCASDTGKCPSIPGSSCADGGACIGALECHDERCLSRCTCAAGQPCADCDAYSQFAGRPNTCRDGWCAYGGY